jgi:AraC-like DNA-binding protein
MFDSQRSPRDEVASKNTGEVLTVVESTMRGRLDAAVGAIAQPVHLDSLFAATAVANARRVRAVLLGPTMFDGDISPGLQRLARACAGSALVAVVGSWSPGLPERLLAFGNQGIRDVVDVTRADELKRLRIILDYPEWEVSQRIANAIRPNLENVTPEMRYFVNSLIRLAPSETSAKRVAAELGVRDASLTSRFFRARLPTPKKYLAAMRLLYAAGVLESKRVSMAQAARRLNYSSPQSFGRHVREKFDVSLGEFREEYSFDLMANYFISRLLFQHRTTLHWFNPFAGRSPVGASERDDSRS